MRSIRRNRGPVLFLFVFFLAGAIGLNLPYSRTLFQTLVPWSLLLSYLFLIAFHRSEQRLKAFWTFSLIAIAGFLAEVAGVATGHVFGSYTYGETLGWSWFEVPLLIGMNWAMLAYCVYVLMSRLKWPDYILILLGAAIMTAYDFLMEPVAVALGMWSWDGGIIPVQNYMAWFILSAIFLTFMRLVKVRYRNAIALPLFLIQAGFFGLQYLLIYLKSLLG